MLKTNKKIIVGVLLLVAQFSLFAQNNTNSPYTRFGYGQLADRSFGVGRSMGGLGVGLRSKSHINPMNPASYSSIDSLTFLFDFGVSGQLSWFDDGVNKQHDINGNIEYVALEFPITRRLALSAGILPFSHVGYKFGQQVEQESGLTYAETFLGTGSVNDFYVGLAFDVWKKRLSVGANVGYLSGNITHERNLDVSSGYDVYRYRKLEVRDLKLDLGVQYTHPISKTESIILGATFSPNNKLNNTSYDVSQYGDNSTTAGSEADTIKGQNFEIPTSLGLGFTYNKRDKITVGMDFLYENWKDCQFFSSSDNFKNRIKLSTGIEYIPKNFSHNVFQSARYRAGLNYSNSYLNVNGNSYNEYGASVGIGLPLVDRRSFINIGFEYVKVKPGAVNMIDEQYFKFTINYTFNERWFFKFKVD